MTSEITKSVVMVSAMLLNEVLHFLFLLSSSFKNAQYVHY